MLLLLLLCTHSHTAAAEEEEVSACLVHTVLIISDEHDDDDEMMMLFVSYERKVNRMDTYLLPPGIADTLYDNKRSSAPSSPASFLSRITSFYYI